MRNTNSDALVALVDAELIAIKKATLNTSKWLYNPATFTSKDSCCFFKRS